MRIGIITYYRVANFGANLQAISTYKYLKNAGHLPIFIHYMSRQLYAATDGQYSTNAQVKAHLDFVDSVILDQTETCFNADDINKAITKYNIEALIIGSDAVLQHHPLLSRIHIEGRRLKRISIERVNDERMFPNLFWGCNINPDMRKTMMSASAQNSAYKLFTSKLKGRMNEALSKFSYISVRDTWTRDMLKTITGKEIPITPDPVFAFNQNAPELIPSKDETLKKFGLPEKYLLVSFLNVGIPTDIVNRLKDRFEGYGECVAFPSPIGVRFSHCYEHEIPLPLSPADWYALIEYSSGYIGNNMHPIVVALHNNVPCFSIDNYSCYDFFGRPQDNGASKIEDLLRRFHLEGNRVVPYKDNTKGLDIIIEKCISSFPKDEVKVISSGLYDNYRTMMESIIKSLQQ